MSAQTLEQLRIEEGDARRMYTAARYARREHEARLDALNNYTARTVAWLKDGRANGVAWQASQAFRARWADEVRATSRGKRAA